MSYFKYENHEVSFFDSRLESNPLLKVLFTLKYNRGYKGDSDGRRRLKGKQELAFLFYMTEYTELFRYKKEERLGVALSNAGFPKDYKITPELQAALEFLQKETTTLARKALDTASNMIHNFNKAISVINNVADRIINDLEEDTEADESDIESLIKMMAKAVKLNEDLDSMVDQIKKTEDKLNHEQELIINDRVISDWEKGKEFD